MSKPQARPRGGANLRDVKAFTPMTRSLVMNNELVIYGVIDSFVYDELDTTVRAIDVMASLTEMAAAETIVVRINSPGGSVVEGLAIYNTLRAVGKPIEVHVDAMAASVASIIAMAGDKVVMAETATIMIHDPWGVAIGGSEDMRRNADEIDRLKAILVGIYASKTGLDTGEIEALMAAETYMSAPIAIEKGFADEVENALAIAACAPLPKQDLARLLAPLTMRAERPSAERAAPAKPRGKVGHVVDAVRARMQMRARAAGLPT